MLQVISINNIELEIHITKPTSTRAMNSIVDNIWNDAKQISNLFNGKIFSVVKVEKSIIAGEIREYKEFFAQQKKPELYDTLNINPLAISGLLQCNEGLIFGLRGNKVTQEKNRWELIPSGSIDCTHINNNLIDFRAQLFQELEEEIGIHKNEVTQCRPFILIQDNASHVIDIGVYIKLNKDFSYLKKLFAQQKTHEYSTIEVIDFNQISDFLKTHDVILTSKELIHHWLTKHRDSGFIA